MTTETWQVAGTAPPRNRSKIRKKLRFFIRLFEPDRFSGGFAPLPAPCADAPQFSPREGGLGGACGGKPSGASGVVWCCLLFLLPCPVPCRCRARGCSETQSGGLIKCDRYGVVCCGCVCNGRWCWSFAPYPASLAWRCARGGLFLIPHLTPFSFAAHVVPVGTVGCVLPQYDTVPDRLLRVLFAARCAVVLLECVCVWLDVCVTCTYLCVSLSLGV